MARPLRSNVPGDIHHVTQHGIDAMPIFRDDDDATDFLRRLAVELGRSDWTCLAYCLMKTHYHLLVQPRKATLSSGFQHLNGRYACAFNRRHGRRGHLFEAAFRDRIVDSEHYRSEVQRYIHLNPTRTRQGMAPESYPWSDYAATIGALPPDPLVDPAMALEPFGEALDGARRSYAAYVAERDVRARRCQTRVKHRGSS